MTAAEVIQLFAEPEKLMRRCYLQIAGGGGQNPPANGQANVATFRVDVTDKTATGFTTGMSGLVGRKKDRPFVRITKLSGAAKNTAALSADEFNAYYVPMVQTSDVGAGTSHYTLPTAGMPTIMITSKLSGCTFGIGSTGTGATLVSHVQPDLSLAKGPTRDANLSTAVGTNFAATPSVFSKGNAYAETAAVIGVRTGTTWNFYMQATDYQNSQAVISNVTVV